MHLVRPLIRSACFSVLLNIGTAFAGVDQVRIIVENDPQRPGRAQVFFPHLGRWLSTDASGIIPLPRPFGQSELITVVPTLREIYGPSFKRVFPIRDGIVSLRAIPVTAAIREKALELVRANKPAEAATAFALTAKREESSDRTEALKNQQMAYEALGQEYRVQPAYIREDNTVRASPRLVAAITSKLGRTLVPSDGRFTVDDFRQAAEMKSYSPIVSEPQEKFFAKRERHLSTATTR